MRRTILFLAFIGLMVTLLLGACERFPQTAVAPAAAPAVNTKASPQSVSPTPEPTRPCQETPGEDTGQCVGEALTPTPPPLILPTPAAATQVDVGEQRIIRVYKEVGPSVVNITTRVVEFSFFYGPVPTEGAGSGFLWDTQGHIVTNFHVIKDAQSIEVSFSADDVMPAKVVGADPINDLAVLKVERIPDGLIPLSQRLGDSDNLQVGQRAIAIGNPFGRFDRTLTAGVVSALGRTIETNEGGRLRKAIQTDAAINRGNSGGPLLDGDGRLIGVNSAIFSPTGTSAGIGFAIPVNTVKRVVPVLIEKGRYPHPWLGAIGYDITPRLAQLLHLPVDKGLLVARVFAGGPADKAGLRGATRQVIIGNSLLLIGGDVITEVDGQPVKSWDDLEDYLELEKRVGDPVTLTVIRDGKTIKVKVILEEAPQGV